MGLFSKSKNKCCEFCGINSSNYIYRYIAETMNVIFLKNPNILQNDTVNQIITLKDGRKFDYTLQSDEDHVVNLLDFTLHIFCTDKCEDRFLKKFGVALRNDIHLTTFMLDWKGQNIFSPSSYPTDLFCPKEVWENCDQCGDKFPSTKSYNHILKYKCYDIIRQNIEEGTLNNPPDKLEQYGVIASDILETKPEGKYYMYEPDFKSVIENQFCSKECVYNYCKSNNKFAVSKNNIEKGMMTFTTPNTIDINNSLGNKFIYRPHLLRK